MIPPLIPWHHSICPIPASLTEDFQKQKQKIFRHSKERAEKIKLLPIFLVRFAQSHPQILDCMITNEQTIISYVPITRLFVRKKWTNFSVFEQFSTDFPSYIVLPVYL